MKEETKKGIEEFDKFYRKMWRKNPWGMFKAWVRIKIRKWRGFT